MTHSPEIPDSAFTLIIGAMKSATTSLYDNLAKHPDVCPSVIKEPEYFSKQDHGVDKAQYPRYEDLWPQFEKRVHRCCLEASTGYTKYPTEKDVPKRIKAYGLNPRFIYVVRNPFDRIESQLNYMRFKYPSADYDFTDPCLIEWSRYATQLDQFLQYFPDRERYRVVTFANLVGRPQDTLRELYDFMEIDPDVRFPMETTNKTPSYSSLEYVFRRLGVRSLAQRLLPGTMRRGLLRMLRSTPPNAKLKLSQSDRDRIRDALWDDMQRLRREFGVPVENWGF